ncbi:MAG TPA: hypothetical protein VFR68_07590 [Candidatus Dormibacteraeota bacterium]|nr:hypothetical protein [Candidatus Dormibacteraeota bacterium]
MPLHDQDEGSDLLRDVRWRLPEFDDGADQQPDDKGRQAYSANRGGEPLRVRCKDG